MPTPNLALVDLVAAQSQPHIPINTSLRRLDAAVQLTVIAIENDPPAGSPGPNEGDRYIVGTGPSGEWGGHEGDVAMWVEDAWLYLTPQIGWVAYVEDAGGYKTFEGGSPASWTDFTGGASAGSSDPRTGFSIVDDFMNDMKTSGPWPWTAASSGTGASSQTVGEVGHPGVVVIDTGTTSAGYTYAVYGSSTPSTPHDQILVGGGQIQFDAVVKISATPDGTDQFWVRIGLGNLIHLTTSPSAGIHFDCDSSTGVWKYVCRLDASNATTVDDAGSLAISAGTWTHLRIIVSADGSEVTFYVDGSLRATISTNIPSDGMTMIMRIQKVASTADRALAVDVMSVSQSFTTPRW